MNNHPLFGFQDSLLVERLVVINSAPGGIGVEIIHTDMTGRTLARLERLADAEVHFINTAIPKLTSIGDVSFDPILLRDMNHSTDHIATVLSLMIRRQANLIASKTYRGAGKAVVVSRWALKWLFPEIDCGEESASYPHGREDSGLIYMGTIRNSPIMVYLCPPLPRNTPALISYTGAETEMGKRDAGAFCAKVNGIYATMIPDNDPPNVLSRWTNYYGIVPVIG